MAETEYTLVSTGRTRLDTGGDDGAGSKRKWKMFDGTRSFWLTERAPESVPVLIDHLSTPHVVTPILTVCSCSPS
jgi:hypothetical protein